MAAALHRRLVGVPAHGCCVVVLVRLLSWTFRVTALDAQRAAGPNLKDYSQPHEQERPRRELPCAAV
jgi:hypothetical protein